MKSPFRYFKTSPEVIRLAVMMYVRFPLPICFHWSKIDLKTNWRHRPRVGIVRGKWVEPLMRVS